MRRITEFIIHITATFMNVRWKHKEKKHILFWALFINGSRCLLLNFRDENVTNMNKYLLFFLSFSLFIYHSFIYSVAAISRTSIIILWLFVACIFVILSYFFKWCQRLSPNITMWQNATIFWILIDCNNFFCVFVWVLSSF